MRARSLCGVSGIGALVTLLMYGAPASPEEVPPPPDSEAMFRDCIVWNAPLRRPRGSTREVARSQRGVTVISVDGAPTIERLAVGNRSTLMLDGLEMRCPLNLLSVLLWERRTRPWGAHRPQRMLSAVFGWMNSE